MALAFLATAGTAWPQNAPQEPKVDVIASGLEAPWALAFAPGGDLFVTERTGRIRVIRDGHLVDEPGAALNVAAVGEAA